MGLSQILENLYIGCFEDVRQTSELIKADVTAILTVDQKPLPSPYHESFVCKHVLLLDLEEEDLLGKLPDSIEFIDTYRTDGKSVFVHWYALFSIDHQFSHVAHTKIIRYLIIAMQVNLEVHPL